MCVGRVGASGRSSTQAVPAIHPDAIAGTLLAGFVHWLASFRAIRVCAFGLFVCLFVCLFVHLPVCLLLCLSVCLFACLPVCLFVYLSVCLFATFVCLSVCLFVCLFVCPFACLSVCTGRFREGSRDASVPSSGDVKAGSDA